MTPQMTPNSFLPIRPASRPPPTLTGRKNIFHIAPSVVVCGAYRLLPFRLVPQRQVWLPVDGMACLDLASALDLGVEFRAEQDHGVGDPQPDEEHDHRG